MKNLTQKEAHLAVEKYDISSLTRLMSRALKSCGFTDPSCIGINSREDFIAFCDAVRKEAFSVIDENASIRGMYGVDVKGEIGIAIENVIKSRVK